VPGLLSPRRFDSELSQAHEETQRERLQREKLSREKDVLVAEVFGLKQLLEVSSPRSSPQSPNQWVPRAHGDPLSRQDKDSDIAGLTQKAEALEAELQDISSQESKDEASLAKVKKQLRDLEAKVKDQEEELDEQAGTIQMLEQVRRGGARFLGGVVSCRAVITWAGLAREAEAVALSPALGQALRLPTRLLALRAMARQVAMGQAARPASDQGVFRVSGALGATWGGPHVPFSLTAFLPCLQAKLRLEMEMERLRQTHAKEVESRDEEVEEIRQSCQKKVGLGCGPFCPGGTRMHPPAPAGCRGAASQATSRSHGPVLLAWQVQPVPLLPWPVCARLCTSGCTNTQLVGSPRVPSMWGHTRGGSPPP